MTSYTYLGYGTTGSDGVAQLKYDENGDELEHSYTGSGVGEVDIVASLDDPNSISDSSLQSETYEVWDTLKYDNATSSDHNDIWSLSNTSNTQLDRLSEYSKISEITAETDAWISVKIDHACTLEFDVQLITTNLGRAFCQYGQSQNATTRLNMPLPSGMRTNDWHHLKLSLSNGTITISSPELETPVTMDLSNYDSTMDMYFRFRTDTEITEINFKNFKYYSN